MGKSFEETRLPVTRWRGGVSRAVSRVIRVRYENGVLKPLERVDFREGEVVLIRIEKPSDRARIVDRFKGFLGEISEDELEELIEEAELEKL